MVQIAKWKKERPFTFTPNKPGALLKPQAVVQELYEQTAHRDDVVIATGVGQHQMWAAQHYRSELLAAAVLLRCLRMNVRWHQPHSIVTSGGLGTMGFGVPTAIGNNISQFATVASELVMPSASVACMWFALRVRFSDAKVACPDETVIDIDGEASFSMTAMEMATAAEYRINAKWLVLNNEYQGMVRQWQDLFYGAVCV